VSIVVADKCTKRNPAIVSFQTTHTLRRVNGRRPYDDFGVPWPTMVTQAKTGWGFRLSGGRK
jgi:hypothetical protein